MRNLGILFAAAAVLLTAGAAQAGDVPLPKDTWTSFKPGSSVTIKTSIKTTPHLPEQEGEGELRMTLVSIDDQEYVVKSEKRLDGEWTNGEETTHSRKPSEEEAAETKAAPGQPMGEEKLSIEGSTYVCKKTKTVSKGATKVAWVHKQQGELKSETTGPGDEKATSSVTALAKKVTIAGKKVSCREEKTVSSHQGIETTIVILTSSEVPSGNVRLDLHATGQGVTVDTVVEVTAFEAK